MVRSNLPEKQTKSSKKPHMGGLVELSKYYRVCPVCDRIHRPTDGCSTYIQNRMESENNEAGDSEYNLEEDPYEKVTLEDRLNIGFMLMEDSGDLN